MMERKLKRINLNYEIFEGVDGLELSKEELQKNIDPMHQYPRQFSRGELGCFLSHYAVLKRIVAEELPYALILEDDVNLSPRLPAVLKAIEMAIEPGEVISLYASFPEPCKLFKEKNIDQSYYFVKPYTGELVVGAAAYVITYQAAQNMIKNILPMDNVIDDWRVWLRRKYIDDFKIVFPHPIDLTDMYSDIHESFGNIDLKIKKMIVNNEFPILANFIMNNRKRNRWAGRINNIIIDGKKPGILFF